MGIFPESNLIVPEREVLDEGEQEGVCICRDPERLTSKALERRDNEVAATSEQNSNDENH